MGEREVPVWVRVGFLQNSLFVMPMIVMLFVMMDVVVLDCLMPVRMRVVSSEEYGHSGDHQDGGGGLVGTPSLAQDRHSHQRADEGSGGKEARLARSAQQPEGPHIEDQADPITDKSEKQCRQRDREWWPPLAGDGREAEHPEPGAEGLDARDRQRIAKREPLTQIVVDRPA